LALRPAALGALIMFRGQEGPSSVLAGLTIVGGAGDYWPDAAAGGITCTESSAPLIVSCWIKNNLEG